jgi:hypothetical protein
MGIALWLLCGAAVLAASRAVAPARPDRIAGELFIVLAVSFLAGLLATALDFGGWGELDWRAAAFVILCNFAAIGICRAIRLAVARRAAHF